MFDCFGRLFSGKVAAAPVRLLSKEQAGELDSSPGSTACSLLGRPVHQGNL